MTVSPAGSDTPQVLDHANLLVKPGIRLNTMWPAHSISVAQVQTRCGYWPPRRAAQMPVQLAHRRTAARKPAGQNVCTACHPGQGSPAKMPDLTITTTGCKLLALGFILRPANPPPASHLRRCPPWQPMQLQNHFRTAVQPNQLFARSYLRRCPPWRRCRSRSSPSGRPWGICSGPAPVLVKTHTAAVDAELRQQHAAAAQDAVSMSRHGSSAVAGRNERRSLEITRAAAPACPVHPPGPGACPHQP